MSTRLKSEEEEEVNSNSFNLGPRFPLEVLYNDDSKIPPPRRNAFIVMLAPEVIPDFNVLVTEPYPQFKNVKGYKNLFRPSKEMIMQEARRRDPLVKKLNVQNRPNEKIIVHMATRLGHLQTTEDKNFIIKKEAAIRRHKKMRRHNKKKKTN